MFKVIKDEQHLLADQVIEQLLLGVNDRRRYSKQFQSPNYGKDDLIGIIQ